MTSTEALHFRQKSLSLGYGKVCGVHFDVGRNNKEIGLVADSRQGTVMHTESFLASNVDSFCLFNTPRCWSLPLAYWLLKSVSSPPISKLAWPWQGVFISITQGPGVVLVCCWCLLRVLSISLCGSARPHPSETSADEIKSQAFLQHYSPAFMWSCCTLHSLMTRDQTDHDQCAKGARVIRIRSSETGGNTRIQPQDFF